MKRCASCETKNAPLNHWVFANNTYLFVGQCKAFKNHVCGNKIGKPDAKSHVCLTRNSRPEPIHTEMNSIQREN